MSSVPFIVDLGLSTVQGILRLEDDGVAIDWRPYTMLDEPAGELSTIVIPYGQLESIMVRSAGRAYAPVARSNST